MTDTRPAGGHASRGARGASHVVGERRSARERGRRDRQRRAARGPVGRRHPQHGAHVRARRRARGPQPVGICPHALLPAQARGHEPHHPHRLRPRRDLRGPDRAVHGGLAAPATTRTTSTPEPGRPSLDFPLRHGPAGPRLLQPGDLRHPDVAGRRDRGRAARDRYRHRHRRRRRLLRRRDRQRAHALHGPHPHGAGARRPARRRRRTSARRRSTCRSASRRSTSRSRW